MMIKIRRCNMLLVLVSSYFLQIGISIADEIHLIDGRVLTAESVWEENGLIKYERFNAIVSIEKSKVSKIEYEKNDAVARERSAHGKARMIIEKVWKNDIGFAREMGYPVEHFYGREKEIARKIIEGKSIEELLNNELASQASQGPGFTSSGPGYDPLSSRIKQFGFDNKRSNGVGTLR